MNNTNTKDTTPPGDEEKGDDTAVTVPPAEDNPSRETESLEQADTSTGDEKVTPILTDSQDAQEENTTSESYVTTEEASDALTAEAAPSAPRQPGDKTADELMEEHVGEVPKAEKKFSLASLKSKSEEAVPKSNNKPGTITVGKPNDDTFVRTSAKLDEWAAFDFIELKTEKKLYLLTPDIVEKINELNEDRAQVMIKTGKKRLIYSVTRLGDSFLWPITIMDGDNDWIDSANICAAEAKENWIRVVSNIAAGRYDYVISPSATEPKWPAMTYEEAVLKAFGGKVIDSMGHDVIKQLLGQD